MILRLGLAAAVMAACSCTGNKDSSGASEPVSTAQETSAKIPDAPGGDTGEAAPKAAGTAAAAAAGAPDKTRPAAGGAEQSVPGQMPAMIVKPAKLHVRKGPGTTQPVVRTLTKGEKVTPLGCEKKWCKLGEGEFVPQKYLQKAP